MTINLSQVGLTAIHAPVLKDAIMRNCNLSSLKLAYNNLGDDGTMTVASAIGSSAVCILLPTATSTETSGNEGDQNLSRKQNVRRHHPSLSTIDLGFNQIGDIGCITLAAAISSNGTLQTLCLSGNEIGEKGATALAAALLNDCGISCLHLTANRIGTIGAEVITKAIAQVDAKRQYSMEQVSHSAVKPEQTHVRAVQELHLGGTDMGPVGCLSVFNMILNNHTLRVISLCSTNINDQDVALFSQSISRNKNIPLEIIQLSFNKITCCGVESLTNAIWGSKTLREIALDNNQIRDRGAQLIAVVLTSVKLIALNLGFNKITIAGIQPITKMLATENSTLESLTLSGNAIDTTAAKVISCALAYNTSLQAFCLDNCHLEHEARRHITAGIISNERISLRVVTGFRLGCVIVTLGFPKVLETWSNDQVLKFVHFLWHQKRQADLDEGLDKTSIMIGTAQEVGKVMPNPRVGPADPANVISAAKVAIEKINTKAAKSFMATICSSKIKGSVSYQGSREIAQLLEATPTGNMRVVLLDDNIDGNDGEKHSKVIEGDIIPSTHPKTVEPLAIENVSHNLERSERNIRLVHKYTASLNELKRLPFKESYLWEIHQYFFSPIPVQTNFSSESKKDDNDKELCSQKEQLLSPHALSEYVKIMSSNNRDDVGTTQSETKDESIKLKTHNSSALERKVSFRCLDDAMVISASMPIFSVNSSVLERKVPLHCLNDAMVVSKSVKRATYSTTLPALNNSTPISSESCTKRRTSSSASSSGDEQSNKRTHKRKRKSKTRIDYYPRIKERIEILSSTSSQNEILALMRQILFLERIMLQDRNDIYNEYDGKKNRCHLTTDDIEIIVLELI